MMLGVVVSSAFGGSFISKASYRNILLVSCALLLIATSLLSTLSFYSPEWVKSLYAIFGSTAPQLTPRALVIFYMVLMGLGIGVSFPVVSISSLHNVGFELRGTVTSMVSFFRSIGSAIGVTVLGSVQTSALNSRLSELLPGSGMAAMDPRALLQPEVRASIPPQVLEKLTIGLADSIAFVFLCTLFMAVAALICILLMGKAKMEIPAHTKQKA
jgi:MFS family permease